MTDTRLDRTSLWDATTPMAEHPALAFNVRVNVAIVGGGVAGVTSAYLLKRLGQSVALIDAYQCGSGQTGRHPGHITAVPQFRMTTLIDRLGEARTRAVWEAGTAATARIRAIVREERIHCHFAWVPAWLSGSAGLDFAARRDELRREAAVAQALGIDASYVEHVSGTGRPAVRFDGQARIHPLSYLRVLVDQLPGNGSYVFENTYVDAVEGDGPFVVRSGDYRVTADFVIAATHTPVFKVPNGSDSPRISVARSYVVGGSAPGHVLNEGLYWDYDDDSFRCLRIDWQDDNTLALVGAHEPFSQDVSDGRAAFRTLGERLAERVPGVQPTCRWSGYVVEAPDQLPCIGEVAPGRLLVTGLGDNSLVSGTLGGMVAADAALRRSNPWRELFALDRFSQRAARTPSTFGSRLEQEVAIG
jgi:glycine/D-amino acid oxidase-like deaminating enzyme